MRIKMTQARVVSGRLMECDRDYEVSEKLGSQLCNQGFATASQDYEERPIRTTRKADKTTTMVEASEAKEV